MYRPDIDGLRAIAVLAVVLFHADEHWVPAGYIGVDIFFVISGFLITGIVARAAAQGEFSLSLFYRNRIRRIAPVMWLVVLVTLIVGQLILLPDDLLRLASSALAAGVFAANIYFTWFMDSGYFASDARLEPLLHLWSLGVEEQFYLVWPLLLLLGCRWLQPTILIATTAVITITSFVFAQLYYPSDPMFVYYMLPARAGQLLVGGLCFFTLRALGVLSVNLSTVVVGIGLILIFCSLWLLSPDSVFPGFNAIPVTLGSALVLYGGATRNALSSILGRRGLVSIGLLSYSLYLWHWPVLAFLRYLFADPGAPLIAAALVLIALLSWLSFTLVESPCRLNTAALPVVFVRYMALPGALVLVIAGAYLVTDGYGFYRWDQQYRTALLNLPEQGKRAPSAAYVCQRSVITPELLKSPKCLVGDDTQTPIAVWGDSNMSHYVGALRVLAKRYEFSFRNFASGACPPLLTNPGAFTHAQARRRCNEFAPLVAEHLQRFDVVLVSGNWEWYMRRYGAGFEVALADSLSSLEGAGKRVIVLGMAAHLPGFDRQCKAKALKLPFMDCISNASVPAAPVAALNDAVRRIALKSGAEYLDFNRLLCGQARCEGIIKGKTLYYDSLHLSASGSNQLGRWMGQSGQHTAFFVGLGRSEDATED